MLFFWYQTGFWYWRLDHFVFPLNLAREMNLAAWWVAIAFLLVSVLSYELHARRTADPRAPWLVLSLLFLLLSWDELGSLHERYVRPHAPWAPVVFFAIGPALAAASLYAVWRLLARRESREAAGLLILCFALLAFAVVLDFVEEEVAWSRPLMGLRAGLEEGVELLATFVALAAVARQRGEARNGRIRDLLPDTAALPSIRPVLLALLLLHAALCLLLVPHLDMRIHGNPGAFYPLAVYFLLFCHVATRAPPEPRPVKLWAGLALFLLLSSVLAAFRFYEWWPAMILTRWLPTDALALYAGHLAVMGAFLAALGRSTRRTTFLYAAAALPLPILSYDGSYDGVAAASLLFGLPAYLYAEILWLGEVERAAVPIAERARG